MTSNSDRLGLSTVSRPRKTDGETVVGDSPTVPGDSRRQSETVTPEPSTLPPEDYRPAAWLTFPKYSKRELMWLCERLDHSNHELRQQLFRLRTQLDRTDTKENHDGQ